MTKAIILCLSIGSLLWCQCKPESDKNNDREKNANIIHSDSLTQELNDIYRQENIIGFAVAIMNQDKIIYQHGFGYANRAIKKEYSINTIQNVASISKTFIGIALLKAQELGKLHIDDPVNKYLTFKVINPHYPEEPILIRHLATHTSSIQDTEYYDGKAYVLKEEVGGINKVPEGMYVEINPPESHISMKNYLEKVLVKNGDWYKKDGFLNNKPGEVFEYSNVGATLAAVVLAEATGEPYDNFTTRHILKPLRMSSSGWSFDDIDLSLHTKLYANPETEIPLYSLITYPDGGLITSVTELSNYLMELIKGYSGKGSLLTDESYQKLFTKQLSPANFPGQQEGSQDNEGIFMSFTPEGTIGHSGGDPGVSTYMFFNPETNIGRILLVNTDLGNEDVKQYNSILKKLGEYENKLKKLAKP